MEKFPVEFIEEMSDFIADQLKQKFFDYGLPYGKTFLAHSIEHAIYLFEADMIGRYGSDQRFIDLPDEVDPLEDTLVPASDEIGLLEEGDEWHR